MYARVVTTVLGAGEKDASAEVFGQDMVGDAESSYRSIDSQETARFIVSGSELAP